MGPFSTAAASEENASCRCGHYEQLLEARGVGAWTVDMLMMFTLCRPDDPADADESSFRCAHRRAPDYGVLRCRRMENRLFKPPQPGVDVFVRIGVHGDHNRLPEFPPTLSQ